MIYIILGTKGQFIKMFPLMKLFDEQNISYQYIHTSQHYGIIEENRKLFSIKKPNVYLTLKKKDLANIMDLLTWAPRVLINARKLPIKRGDWVIAHGDTESTLLAFLIAKLHQAKVIHVESGMRSGKILEPFPEEIIRSFIDRFSEVRFCTFEEDAKNLKGSGEIYVTNGNTVFDAAKSAIAKTPSPTIQFIKKSQYVVFLAHRKETFYIRARIEKVIQILEMILQRKFVVVWAVHANTKHQLIAKGFWSRIVKLTIKYELRLNDFFNYVDFIHLLRGCEFAATDGDGVQEETYYLDKPVLILRKVTDSLPGIGENAYISSLNIKKARYFLDNYKNFRRRTKPGFSPSKVIADYCKKLDSIPNA